MDSELIEELGLSLKEFDKEMIPLMEELVSEETLVRQNARKKLAAQGSKVLPQVYKMVSSKHGRLRWEASKIVEEIADKDSIPFLIDLMRDRETEIRWIAAEGLIRIGRSSIIPILNELKEDGDSTFIRAGAHHVLGVLFTEREKEEYQALLDTLKSQIEIGELTPLQASRALKTFNKY